MQFSLVCLVLLRSQLLYHMKEPCYFITINNQNDFADFILLERTIFKEIQLAYSRFHIIEEVMI